MKTRLALPMVMVFLALPLLQLSPALARADDDDSAAAPDSYLMASLGDSITAATLAETSLVDRHRLQRLEDSLSAGRDRQGAIEALRGRFNMENKETFSWTSGLEIKSQFVKLRTFFGLSPTPTASDGDGDNGLAQGASPSIPGLEISNLAKPGEMAEGMVSQARKLKELMDGGQRNRKYAGLKYVTVLIGANDACKRTASADFQAQLRESLDTLATIRQSEPIRVLVSSIPKIPDVGIPEIQNHTTLFGFTCAEFRNQIIGECNDLTTWTTPADYQERLAVVDQINRDIQAVSAEAGRAHPNMRIVYTDRVYRTPIPIEAMAADCFHPNARGQQKLADALWEEQPWFGKQSPRL